MYDYYNRLLLCDKCARIQYVPAADLTSAVAYDPRLLNPVELDQHFARKRTDISEFPLLELFSSALSELVQFGLSS